MQSNDLRKGIVRILNQSGQTAGTGFIVSTQLIATCAHVIKFAGAEPGSVVRCKRLVDGQEFEALVKERYWRDPRNEDVAFLRVKEPFPDDVSLRLGTSANIENHSFYSYGFPAQLPRELPVRGTILDLTVDGNRLVLRSTEIVEGVSGAPVIDQQTHLIVGMVVERIEPQVLEEERTIIFRKGSDTFRLKIPITMPIGRLEDLAYAIPSSVLTEICSELSIKYTCPYLGLSAFTEKEKNFFSGRDKLVEKLVKKLLPVPEFLAVVGSSGSGKSSVVQAGLFPKLQRGELLGFPQNVPIFKLRPSNKDTPEEALLAAFLGVQDSESEESGDVWATVQDNLKQHSSRSIIFIDQFEELFALFPDKQEAFTRGLYELVKAVSEVTLIVTIRSDFYEPLQNSALGHFLPEYQENMPKGFDDEELRTIINKPAKQVGLKLGEGLVDLILTDLKQTKNPLPLLEFTLEQLWKAEHKNNLLTRECYLSDRIGRVTGAIAQWANKTYRNLPSKTEKALARRIFTRLIHYGSASSPDKNSTDVPDTRCRLPFTELISIGEESSDVRSLINKLVDARLLVTDGHTVEIIHDALLTEWTELRGWINKKRTFWFWRQRLDESFREWQDKEKKEGYLLYGAAVGEAEGYLNDDEYRAELNEDERNYIEASVERRDRQKRAEEEQRKRELEVARRRTRIAIFVSVIISGFAIFAGYQWRQAEIGQIRALRTSSEALLESNPLEALKESLRAGKKLKQPLLQVLTPDVQLRNRVIATLQKTVYTVKERKRLAVSQSMLLNAIFSPNGRLLITTGTDGRVRLWDLSGKPLDKFTAHHGRIMGVSFSPNGRLIATAGHDQAVRLWDLSGNQIAQCLGHTAEVWSVSFSPDGRLIASAAKDKTARLWDLNCNQLAQFIGHRERLSSVSFSPDGKFLATSGKDGTARLWNLEGQQLKELRGYRGGNWVYSVSFSPNGRLFATTGGDGSVCLWDYLEDNPQCDRIQAHTGWASWLSFSPDGKFLATSGEDGTARLWNLKRQKIAEFTGHMNRVTRVSFRPDGKLLATVGEDGTARLWDLEGQQLLKFTGFGDSVSKIRFSPSGQFLATAEKDGAARLWDLDGNLIAEFTGHQGPVEDVSFSSDGQLLATAGTDGIALLWNLDGKQLAKLTGHRDRIMSVSFSPNGRLIATAGQDRTARLWDLDGNQIAEFLGHQRMIWSVVFTPDGQQLVTSSDDGTTRLWDLQGKQLTSFQSGYLGGGDYVSISPDGSLLATSGYHGIVELWNLSGKEVKQVAKCEGAPREVTDLNFSPDGQQLATAHTDGTARVWNLSGQSCQQLAEFKHGTWVESVSFSPDGKLLATASSDGTGKLWQIESFDELMKRGCDWVRDYLENNPNVEASNKHLCDGIGSQK